MNVCSYYQVVMLMLLCYHLIYTLILPKKGIVSGEKVEHFLHSLRPCLFTRSCMLHCMLESDPFSQRMFSPRSNFEDSVGNEKTAFFRARFARDILIKILNFFSVFVFFFINKVCSTTCNVLRCEHITISRSNFERIVRNKKGHFFSRSLRSRFLLKVQLNFFHCKLDSHSIWQTIYPHLQCITW